jgi:hypothetical protein
VPVAPLIPMPHQPREALSGVSTALLPTDLSVFCSPLGYTPVVPPMGHTTVLSTVETSPCKKTKRHA